MLGAASPSRGLAAGGVQAAPRLTGALGAGSTNTAGAWEWVSMLISYKMGTLLSLPWQHNPSPCPTRQVAPSAARSPGPGFLITCCSSSCTRRGGNNRVEATLKCLPRPAYSRQCLPGVGLELGGLDSVPSILMSSRQIHHLHWSKLAVFLLLPVELHQAQVR